MKIEPPKIEMIPIDQIQPWEKNPRKDHAVDKIADSIEAFGYQAPIIVQKGTMRVLAGHGRLMALKRLGAEEVPVIIADVDDQEADLYTFADNKLAEIANWDFTKMADTLLDLDAQNLNLELTGFDEEEIRRIMEWAPSDERDETDATPPVPADPISELGDLWELGRHRLICGDSTDPDVVAVLSGNHLHALVATDPPYGVQYSKVVESRENQKKGGWAEMEGDALDDQALEDLVRKVLELTSAKVLFCWHSWKRLPIFFAALEGAGFKPRSEIIWVKNALVFGRSDYQWRHETCIYAKRDGAGGQDDRTATTVWEFPKPTGVEHPTQKPVELFEIPIKNHTQPGEVVYEPFCGSGSQIIAAEKLGRRCHAIELAPGYVDVSVRRWQNFTGKRARNLTREGVEIA